MAKTPAATSTPGAMRPLTSIAMRPTAKPMSSNHTTPNAATGPTAPSKSHVSGNAITWMSGGNESSSASTRVSPSAQSVRVTKRATVTAAWMRAPCSM